MGEVNLTFSCYYTLISLFRSSTCHAWKCQTKMRIPTSGNIFPIFFMPVPFFLYFFLSFLFFYFFFLFFFHRFHFSSCHFSFISGTCFPFFFFFSFFFVFLGLNSFDICTGRWNDVCYIWCYLLCVCVCVCSFLLERLRRPFFVDVGAVMLMFWLLMRAYVQVIVSCKWIWARLRRIRWVTISSMICFLI